FGSALASLALADIQLLFDGPQRPDDLLPEAQASARKALEIDPALKDAHLALDTIRRLDGDVAAADEELDRLLLRQPSADLLARESVSLIRRGRLQNAEFSALQAHALNPASLSGIVWLARALRATGFHQTAVFRLRHAESEHPESDEIPFQLGATYALS